MLEVLFTYTLAVFMLIVTPGPVVALVLRNASIYGFKVALFTSIGSNFASLLLIILAIAVILGVFKVSPFVLSLLSILGCMFIFYLGSSSLYKIFKSYQDKSFQDLDTQLKLDERNVKKTFISSFLEGFSIAISNPKDIIFFIAFFPQFIRISYSITLSLSLLVAIWIILDFCVLMSYAALMQKVIFLSYKNLIGIVSDIILMFVGVFGGYYLWQSL
ncbi:LysE family translocator [Helicobacter muridarum]|uniref:Leucine efflux protein n=1 Tax=Helicobacter muridarum TaxID=216 RepID=A0A099TYU2_9HELI|nr:LysE family translocator [Helicobacter muridarum]TLD99908.1 LysE family translocator [Helicobacter muridarum]STQ86817.1 Leucine efflux protein [Helicobacter muridarum]